jgi:hypothetical protein
VRMHRLWRESHRTRAHSTLLDQLYGWRNPAKAPPVRGEVVAIHVPAQIELMARAASVGDRTHPVLMYTSNRGQGLLLDAGSRSSVA